MEGLLGSLLDVSERPVRCEQKGSLCRRNPATIDPPCGPLSLNNRTTGHGQGTSEGDGVAGVQSFHRCESHTRNFAGKLPLARVQKQQA